ncbi:SMI1/KNR4 family protein SUKH-1 [Elizabethkingia sp. YR214]|uniref:SMI1/KNR4 family protein n=1 Tax=Elizabethkingia sp. YR214 TaxID=2135667 RepID=UPI000D322428|nr:SMI1/KNR4 family protein [Elizabethkingia sp. YR214]PUB28151.1 SMI1/KNR4 family protein SUKH-1 [Elizabethkingia sp. YR214]
MDIEKLKEKLVRLIELDTEGEYEFINEPLTENEVYDFEKKYQIKLPSDFRIFITQLFDGGVGPFQIMPLQYWDSIHNVHYLDSLGNNLTKPFLLKDKIFQEDFVPTESNSNSIINGTIRICHIGCGNFIFLVVNGEEYGNMWVDDRASTNEIFPLQSANYDRMTFGQWYDKWVDERITHFENS